MAASRLQKPRNSSRWWLKFTRKNWRLLIRRRSRRLTVDEHRAKPLADHDIRMPIDGSPPQEQRTRSRLDRTQLGTVSCRLFESPEPLRPMSIASVDPHLRIAKLQARITKLESRVDKLEHRKTRLLVSVAEYLRRLAYYRPDKWAKHADRAARALPPEALAAWPQTTAHLLAACAPVL